MFSAALTVSGTVQDQDGVAAGGALVTFINEADESQRISTVTDDAGRYEIDVSKIGAIPTLVSMSEASETPTEFQLFQVVQSSKRRRKELDCGSTQMHFFQSSKTPNFIRQN